MSIYFTHIVHSSCICSNCYNSLQDLFGIKGFELETEAEVQSLELEEGRGSLKCVNCAASINEGEDYHIISVLDSTLESVADAFSDDIEGCFVCEGEDRAHYAHVYNDDPFSEDHFELPSATEVWEYLSNQGVPEDFLNLFSKLVVCQRCHYGRHDAHPNHNPDGGVFDLNDDIYTRRDIANFWGDEYEEFMEFALQYGVNLTHEDLFDFQEHLIKYPMLAYQHQTGQAIYNLLKKHFENKSYSVLEQKTKLFRGRTRKRDSSDSYTKNQLWSPPEGRPSHGRFNTVGVPVLYVSDCLNGIPYEVPPAHDELLDIIEYELQKDLFVLDISVIDRSFQGFFTEVNEESKPLKRAYLLPNFIGTCCGHIGYDGVRYEGVHKTEEKYINYALFTVKEQDLQSSYPVTYNPKITYNLQEKQQNKRPEAYF
ncbi:RES family NAD+ phosphorylase [Brevibacillus sp. AG]|uniref:RES family NAD+ phosphorylase n=1 Tax=Brevibacillus sp. AG TaxID=3020891 RepID=UPI002330A175|nr:RES family NAD+ phosphorylase [Brevibacillus sp. AG]MDC0764919.1 RES family NAD+ phosphorylase [Brevibacillus sp. AG]